MPTYPLIFSILARMAFWGSLGGNQIIKFISYIIGVCHIRSPVEKILFMCGFVGFWSPKGFHAEVAEAMLCSMRDQLVHRGPDDKGHWVDAERGIALAHRRLSIVDLSPGGHQPMVSLSGRFCLAFNGEIYNHQALRNSLRSYSIKWRGSSDTETFLAAIEFIGLESALEAATGMFAFAVWDRKDHSLVLARDRMGEKPLYYGWQKGVLLFGSELKALKRHGNFVSEINLDVLSLYFKLGYIPAPWSIWQGIFKLVPGSWIKFDEKTINALPEPQAYWSLQNTISNGERTSFRGSEKQAVDRLEVVLGNAIAKQMIADVPLGAFLSGGVDSSTVVALMQQRASTPVKTFTIGFHEKEYNEAQHARKVAEHLGTDHVELYVTNDDARNVVPKLPQMYDEPFADPSAIPTFLVSELAKQDVTVSLSGDGGDELFAGYSRYFNRKVEQTWRLTSRFPRAFTAAPNFLLKQLSRSNSRVLADAYSAMFRIAEYARCTDEFALYECATSQWKNAPVTGVTSQLEFGLKKDFISTLKNPILQMTAFDTATYMPDCILTKVDRAAMAVSLETRVPLLDHRVVEFAWQLPVAMKVKNGVGKWLLRELLYRHVPKSLIERPKKGFSAPIGAWIKDDMREWAEELLSESRIKQQGILNFADVQSVWRRHLLGCRGLQHPLWLVLNFQAWLESQE